MKGLEYDRVLIANLSKKRDSRKREGIAALIGSVCDAHDNALAESTISLFKNEAIRDRSLFRIGPL